MSTSVQLEAGGLLAAKTKADAGATEQIVARTYRHPALGSRAVVRLASDRLGQAEDLAMEFLGFGAPEVSATLAIQQRRSLGFAAWALINDAKNARFALDLVKQMKKAARQARSKPGHAWDAYTAMAKDLGRSARHFLPPFWEEVGRTFKDIGNQTYAGRALNKSLEAERVHAIDSDRARRRDVILEFVLSGCLAGAALSEYGNDLQGQYPPAEAYAIFRDLCVRRTRGGMAPWGALPKDLTKLAKAAKLDADAELESFLEEVIETPAMGRAALQFWKSCSGHCKRIVARNPAFAVALLRHTKPEPRYYGESKLGPWLELLEEWGVFPFLWEDLHRGAPPLGEPVAAWFARIIQDDVPAPRRTLDMLQKLVPRLKAEKAPLQLVSQRHRYGGNAIDLDVLEACLVLGVQVDDPPELFSITFDGWLTAAVDHGLRNQDVIECAKDDRFRRALLVGLETALACKGGMQERGYRQTSWERRPFPIAAGDRPGITQLWREQAAEAISQLENTGLASFVEALGRLNSTLWPDALRLFPDLAERLDRIDPVAMLHRTLQAGVFDEYGLPGFEAAVEANGLKIQRERYGASNLLLSFPNIVLSDKVHAYIVGGDGQMRKRELHLPKGANLESIVVVGDDLAVRYRDSNYQSFLYWLSDPSQRFENPSGWYHAQVPEGTTLPDGSVFFGVQAVRSGDKQLPTPMNYFHDGERFWRLVTDYDPTLHDHRWLAKEVDPQTGKVGRDSVPPWFEQTDGGTIELSACELRKAPVGAEDSPLGVKNGLLGWKAIKRRDGTLYGEGIDGRRWDKPFADGTIIGLLRQPGAEAYLPVTTTVRGRYGPYRIWDPTGTTAIADLVNFEPEYAHGQVALLPLVYWHLLKPRDEKSSRLMRDVDMDKCATLYAAATEDRIKNGNVVVIGGKAQPVHLAKLLPAVKQWLPTAPERMALGVARLIEQAEKAGSSYTTLRDASAAAATNKVASSVALLQHRKSDTAAAHWGLTGFRIYGDEGEASVSAHLLAVAEFLKGSAKAGPLPRTTHNWFTMLDNLPLRFWQSYWRATAARMTSKAAETPWLEFLKHWHDLGLAELPGHFDLMEGHPVAAKKRGWGGYEVDVNGGTAHALESGEDKFIVLENESFHQGYPHHFMRYSTSETPGTPPGFEVRNVRRVKTRCSAAEIAAMIQAAEACAEMPLPTRAELVEIAERLSISPAEIALVWIGGLNLDSYQSNFLPADLRNALGIKANDAGAARQALRNLKDTVRAQFFEAVVALGGAAPFASDRRPVLQAIEKVWRGKMPRRLPLDASLQKRLSALSAVSRWQRLQQEELLAMAAEPLEHPLLQPREHEIKVDQKSHFENLEIAAKKKGESAVSPDTFRWIAQVVALVHAETPAGHPARAEMPALIKQTIKLLDHPSTMLVLRHLQFFSDGKKKIPNPTEWLNTHLGKTKTDAKENASLFDDGLLAAAGLDRRWQALVAFRPAKLKNASDVARLRAILGADLAQGFSEQSSILPVIVAIKSPGFQKLAKAILAKDLSAGQWPANPKLTAPAVVAAIQKTCKLGEDAAVLYAQLLALPDPTTAHICTWNGWGAAQFKKAAAELVSRKLVLEASRARAGRPIFLPGEWIELKTPWLPIEKWKLPHLAELGEASSEEPPLGGPMVLRPFDELFAAAWKRVVDGDEPRYEEVKRKKR
jgi:hypothetical protein